jgi:uncharacterized protein
MSDAVPVNAVAWFEIPVTDMKRSRAFYEGVLGHAMSDMEGPNPMAAFAAAGERPVSGHIYPGRPAAAGTGPTIHFAVTGSLEDALARVTDNGGSVVSPIIEIAAGRFAYCLDPDGNSFGLFR